MRGARCFFSQEKQVVLVSLFIFSFEHILHLALVFLYLTLSRQIPAGDRSPIFYVHIRDLLTKSMLLPRIYFFFWGANWSSVLIQSWRNLSEPLLLGLMYSIDKFIKRFFAEIIIGTFAIISVKYNFRFQFWKIGFHDSKCHLIKVWEASL